MGTEKSGLVRIVIVYNFFVCYNSGSNNSVLGIHSDGVGVLILFFFPSQ